MSLLGPVDSWSFLILILFVLSVLCSVCFSLWQGLFIYSFITLIAMIISSVLFSPLSPLFWKSQRTKYLSQGLTPSRGFTPLTITCCNYEYLISEIIKSSQLVTWKKSSVVSILFLWTTLQRAVSCSQSSLGLILIWHKASVTACQTPQTPGTVTVSSEAPKSKDLGSCKFTFHVAELMSPFKRSGHYSG